MTGQSVDATYNLFLTGPTARANSPPEGNTKREREQERVLHNMWSYCIYLFIIWCTSAGAKLSLILTTQQADHYESYKAM